MRVEEVMAEAGIDSHGRPIEDGWIVVTCPACGTDNNLAEVDTEESGSQTVYLCGNCGERIVVVGPSPGLTGGYRLKDWVVLPLGEMRMNVPPD